MKDTWRLIDFESFDAATNMAVDEAILEAHLENAAPPTLRFYGWAPPAVSIGYGQKLPEKARQKIHARGFDIVRRPTGGRAVLHLDELTYSFVGSNSGANTGSDKLLGSSVIESYRKICEALIAGFKNLAVSVEIGQGQTASRQQHDCFTATTTADLHYQGKKIVGSAQLRRHDALLQHGSILLCQEQNLMSELLAIKDIPVDQVQQRHANLFEITGIVVSATELIPAFKKGFEETFSIELVPGELLDIEWSKVEAIKERQSLLA